jgi:muconolactone delta-isomerase
MPAPQPTQTEIFFPASLDFPGRNALTVPEIAGRLSCWPQHVHHLIESGELPAGDLAMRGAKRTMWRVPAESYRNFLVRKFGAVDLQADLVDQLRQLPRAQLVEMRSAIDALLGSGGKGSAS